VKRFTVAIASISTVADVTRAVIRSYVVAACRMFTAVVRRCTFVHI